MTARYIAAGPPVLDDTWRHAWECPVPTAVLDQGGPGGWHCAFDGTERRPRARWWRTDYSAAVTGPARRVRQTRTVGPWTLAADDGALL